MYPVVYNIHMRHVYYLIIMWRHHNNFVTEVPKINKHVISKGKIVLLLTIYYAIKTLEYSST